jgi:AcrR family transcriptional regulator
VTESTDRYHHGDLPAALRAATAELVHERGAAGFSLREVARRAGVSHAAPAHHFGDQRGLLTSVAVEGFGQLHAAFLEAADGVRDAAELLRRMNIAYVSTGLTFPGHFAIAFRPDLVDSDDVGYQECGAVAYGDLVRAIEMLAEQYNPSLDIDTAARLCWSAMHGLLQLFGDLMTPDPSRADHPTQTTASIEELADRFTGMLLSGMLQSGTPLPH